MWRKGSGDGMQARVFRAMIFPAPNSQRFQSGRNDGARSRGTDPGSLLGRLSSSLKATALFNIGMKVVLS